MTIKVTNNNINIKSLSFKSNSENTFGKLGNSNDYNNQVSFKKYDIPPKTDKKLERKVFITTLIGVATALCCVMKGKKYSLNPNKILHTKVGKWGIFDVKQYNELNILGLAAGSISGGLIGGMAFDKKENRHAKFREAIIQIVGNVLTPVAFVSTGARFYNKIKPSILKHIPSFKESSNLAKHANKLIKYVPSFGIVGTFLAGGILSGNYIGNTINNKCFNVEKKRKIKLADFSAHIDDICLAASLVATGGPLGAVSKIVPAALMVSGISTGVAQSTNNCTKDSNE